MGLADARSAGEIADGETRSLTEGTQGMTVDLHESELSRVSYA